MQLNFVVSLDLVEFKIYHDHINYAKIIVELKNFDNSLYFEFFYEIIGKIYFKDK